MTTVSLEWSHIHFQFKMNKVLCAIFMQQREYINGEVSNQLNRETSMLMTDIVHEYVGGNAKETAYQFFKKKFDEEFEVDGEFYWLGINGYTFNIRPCEDCTFIHCDDLHTQHNTQMPWSSNDMPRTTFEFIHDCMKCQVCPMRLARCSDFGICEQCQQQWHEVPCRGCGSQFGSLTDGKHSWC